MKTSCRVAVVISDLHCGSTVGLMHDDCVVVDADSERQIPQRPYQKWLWACWRDFVAESAKIIGKSDHVLIVNGDCIEGVHHGGRQTVSDKPKHHVEIAQHVLSPIAERAKDVYVVRGTECHTESDEHTLGLMLGAVRDPVTKLNCFDHLPLNIGGVLASFRHHIGVTSRVHLEATGLSVHLANEQLECVRAGWPVPRLMFRAHRHRHGEYTDGDSMMIVTGAWQGETRHVHKVAVGAVSRPSWVIADWRGKADGELPNIHRRIYAPPARKDA